MLSVYAWVKIERLCTCLAERRWLSGSPVVCMLEQVLAGVKKAGPADRFAADRGRLLAGAVMATSSGVY